MNVFKTTMFLFLVTCITFPVQNALSQDTEVQDTKDASKADKVTEAAAKTAIKQGAKAIAKKAGGPVVDAVWPSKIGENKAVEDPSSKEFKDRQERLDKEKAARERAIKDKAAREQAAREHAAREKAAREQVVRDRAERDGRRERIEREHRERRETDREAWESGSCRRC